jgi:hypothetical protein
MGKKKVVGYSWSALMQNQAKSQGVCSLLPLGNDSSAARPFFLHPAILFCNLQVAEIYPQAQTATNLEKSFVKHFSNKNGRTIS